MRFIFIKADSFAYAFSNMYFNENTVVNYYLLFFDGNAFKFIWFAINKPLKEIGGRVIFL